MGSSAHPRGRAVPNSDLAVAWSEFRRIAEHVHARAGSALSETSTHFFRSRLVKWLRAIGGRSFREGGARTESSDGYDERQAIFAAMTTKLTRCLHEDHHIAFLKERILPQLLDDARNGERVRIWSVGTASGEEAYAVALAILDIMPDADGFDIRILATDTDREMLCRAEAGIYDAWQLAGLPARLRSRWFRTVAGRDTIDFQVVPEMRSLVQFKELNLLHDWPMTGQFDVILCRDVMIHFDEPARSEMERRFARRLLPGGLLCIGHPERIATAGPQFELIGQTIYRRRWSMPWDEPAF